MTTTEQKIEKLLKDLDSYACYNSYDRGLPLGSESCKNKMKAIVQAFVDSLKEGDDIKDFDENKLNAYRAFIKVGIPDEWAKVMAGRVNSTAWRISDPEADGYIRSFALWCETSEGQNFWYNVALKVEMEGVSAFSKFQCPK